MIPLALSDGTIINLAFVRALTPYTDNTYRLTWSDGTTLDLIGPDAAIMTAFLTGKVTIHPTLQRPAPPTH